ncbi:MAG: cadherin-like beta sandwich domain-containing protein [Clostridium sp.]|uniref:cadherin-like beta sandwich domain-containing protein n=1 Tax=Clostridium sp. TaxID=1506 RepID=UPI0025C4854C|nr:cadherin-like beta sandwich domain-containing protein [Clostridium sp.]MCE5222200.1 cadherin-like beta sandwich domain-containing protein [Clostridium sp.]
MSKSIRNIFAAIFIIGVFSFIEPNSLSLMTTKAYAEEKPYLKSIYLSEGDNLNFSQDVYSYIVDVDKDTEGIFIKAKPNNPSDTVKINGQEVTKDDNYKESLTLDKGKNIAKIEVEDSDTKSTSTYTVYIYRGGKDAVYLKDININGSTIGFDKSSTFYNIELDEGTDIVDLETVPIEGTYSITVNGKVLDETNSIKLKFKGIGKYTINIGLKDEDTQRVGAYTLNIYLGIPVSPNVSDSINKVLKPNQWVIVNGRWRYNDYFGNCLKDTWFYDNKYKSYFYFNSRGNMETGWIEEGGNSYYLNSKGEMQTGWLFYENEWYFLDSYGVMRTGWIEDNDKWYFLRTDGSMATGWILNKDKWYYLYSSGVMKTGWLYCDPKWYYLDSYGAMETGWIKCDDEWYYFNSDGSMKSGEWLYDNGNWYYLNYVGNMRCGWLYKDDKYYYFNEDGTMRTSSKTIDGYTYYFNEDGSVNFG